MLDESNTVILVDSEEKKTWKGYSWFDYRQGRGHHQDEDILDDSSNLFGFIVNNSLKYAKQIELASQTISSLTQVNQTPTSSAGDLRISRFQNNPQQMMSETDLADLVTFQTP